MQHQIQAADRWKELNIYEQLANVGSEVFRTISWREKGRSDLSQNALFRVLELLDLTIADHKNQGRLKELCRAREMLVDYLWGDNEYRSSDRLWEKYFLPYNYAARLKIAPDSKTDS